MTETIPTRLAPPPPLTQAQTTGWALAIFTQFAFSLATPIVKAAVLIGLVPTTVLVVRLLITTSLLGLTVLVTAPQHFRIDRRGLLVCGVAGTINAFGMLGYFWSLKWLSASVAIMVYTLSPLVLLVLLALIGERFTHRNLVRVGLGLAGVYLLIGPGGQVSLIGVALALTAVFSVPIQLILMQLFLRQYDWRAVTFYLSLVMLCVLSLWWVIQGAEWHAPGIQGWLLMVVLAVVTTYLSRLAQTNAVARLGAGQVGLLAPLETLLTVIWSALFLSERLTFIQTLGGGLILLSALLASQRLMRVRWNRMPH